MVADDAARYKTEMEAYKAKKEQVRCSYPEICGSQCVHFALC